MKLCAVLSLVLLPHLTDGTTCGTLAKEVDQRIIGGIEVEYFKYPWFVALTSTTKSGRTSVSCGGSLISPGHVLTAAHCYVTAPTSNIKNFPKLYKLMYKLSDSCKNTTGHSGPQARTVCVHQNYDVKSQKNDIALITLIRESPLTPACLPSPNAPLSGQGIIIGFGKTSNTGSSYPCVLNEATVTFITRERCISESKIPKNVLAVLPKVFCAGTSDGSIDSCQGDSGGPIHKVNSAGKYAIRGVTSFGFGCARKGYPGVYTDVAQYIDWISDEMKDSTKRTNLAENIVAGRRPIWMRSSLDGPEDTSEDPPTDEDSAITFSKDK